MGKNKIDCQIIHGGLTPLIQSMDAHANNPFKSSMRDKWETWLESGKAEFAKGGKRKRASYELIANWVYETWTTTVSK